MIILEFDEGIELKLFIGRTVQLAMVGKGTGIFHCRVKRQELDGVVDLEAVAIIDRVVEDALIVDCIPKGGECKLCGTNP